MKVLSEKLIIRSEELKSSVGFHGVCNVVADTEKALGYKTQDISTMALEINLRARDSRASTTFLRNIVFQQLFIVIASTIFYGVTCGSNLRMNESFMNNKDLQ